jgi:hypothetical protein
MVVDTVSPPVVALAPTGLITFANATFARLMWREDPSMCIGKMLEDFLDSSDLALFGRLHQGGGSLLWKVKNP